MAPWIPDCAHKVFRILLGLPSRCDIRGHSSSGPSEPTGPRKVFAASDSQLANVDRSTCLPFSHLPPAPFVLVLDVAGNHGSVAPAQELDESAVFECGCRRGYLPSGASVLLGLCEIEEQAGTAMTVAVTIIFRSCDDIDRFRVIGHKIFSGEHLRQAGSHGHTITESNRWTFLQVGVIIDAAHNSGVGSARMT